MNKSKIRPFLGNFLLVQSGSANIVNVKATIKKLMLGPKELKISPDMLIFQSFLLEPVFSEFHIEAAVEQSISSFRENSNRLGNLSLEFLMRLTAQRELDKALEICGLRRGKSEICIVIFADSEDACTKLYNYTTGTLLFEEDNSLLAKNSSKNKSKLSSLFEIPSQKFPLVDKDKKFAENFILEKMALAAFSD